MSYVQNIDFLTKQGFKVDEEEGAATFWIGPRNDGPYINEEEIKTLEKIGKIKEIRLVVHDGIQTIRIKVVEIKY